ncbi:hypothetical protein C8T65DRAFT_211783 [Cerioporus squamosus]|nr:hypothetical protein C8T65DRAFT_211783 [Cerioporus squamosus]
MSGSVDDDYAAEIRFMTSILSGQKFKLGQLMSSRHRTHNEVRVRPFAHLATLLSNRSSPTVAATGSIKPSGVDVVIVLSGSSTTCKGHDPFSMQPVFDSQVPAVGGNPVSVEQVKRAEIEAQSSPVSIEKHARDVFEVLRYVHRGDVHLDSAKQWVVSRSYRELAARLERIKTSWRDQDLIALLKSWKPQPRDNIAGYLDFSAPEHRFLRKVLEQRDLLDEENHVQLSGDGTARFVGDCIGSLLERLRIVVPRLQKPEDLTFVSEALSVLQVLLSHEKTRYLFTQTSLVQHTKPSSRRSDKPRDIADVACGEVENLDEDADEGVLIRIRKSRPSALAQTTSPTGIC